MYGAFADPYCYPGTTVLKNIPGLRDAQALDRFELSLTDQRAREPLPVGRLSVRHYRSIHWHLFRDVYPWAGRFRTVRIAKEQSVFCYPENIDKEMRRVFADLKGARFLRGEAPQAFAVGAAHVLSEVNAIHPFRDGNGRAQLAFIALLGARAGHPMDFEQLERERYLSAMKKSFQGDERPLAAELWRFLTAG
jgi:cell filamentation protein, protein adenylyltransferase